MCIAGELGSSRGSATPYRIPRGALLRHRPGGMRTKTAFSMMRIGSSFLACWHALFPDFIF